MTFLDTNILIYAISPSPAERSKAEIAREILRRNTPTSKLKFFAEKS